MRLRQAESMTHSAPRPAEASRLKSRSSPALSRSDRTLIRLAGVAGGLLLRSLRYRLAGEEHYLRFREQGRPVIFAVWHSQLLLAIHHARLFGVTTLASPTRDGEIGARVGERLDVMSIRGDERYGPLDAYWKLAAVLKRGGDLGIFPDGPLGPARRVKPGILLLAQRYGCPIIPVGSDINWKLTLNSGWDRFVVPLPFARVRLCFGEPVFLAKDASREQRDAAAREISDQIGRLSRPG